MTTIDTLVSSRSEQLTDRLIAALGAASELLTIELGRRLGLYEALFDLGPTTSTELAAVAGITERYAREWLEQQAVAGLLDVTSPGDAQSREYLLPAAHVPVLVEPEHPLHTLGAAALLEGFALALPEVADAFRTGDGVSYARFGDEVREGIASLNRPGFRHATASWIASMPDIAARLHEGGLVLDAGCGTGWSTIALALAFPEARIVGADTDTASIVAARENARNAGVGNRIHFIEVNVSQPSTIRSPFDGDYDLITVFEALHDMGEPIEALAAFHDVLAPGGAVFVADERTADAFTVDAGEVERLHYAASVLHCLPATMAESTSVANGTVLRAPTVAEWAARAGLSMRRLQIEHPLWQFYRLDPAS